MIKQKQVRKYERGGKTFGHCSTGAAVRCKWFLKRKGFMDVGKMGPRTMGGGRNSGPKN